MATSNNIQLEQGIICRRKNDPFGHFSWPSIAQTDDNKIIVVASGLRAQHACPWGKTVFFTSSDAGTSWSEPNILNDTPLDDRDAGITPLKGQKHLISWFTSDPNHYRNSSKDKLPADLRLRWDEDISSIDNKTIDRWKGSWIRIHEGNQCWSMPIKVPVTSPHGPIRLADGTLLYLGKILLKEDFRAILAYTSTDSGYNWKTSGTIPIPEKSTYDNFHEPHVVELPSGKLVAMVRYQHSQDSNHYKHFSLFQTESYDHGLSWSQLKPTGVYGSPPHLIRHSSGSIICSYGHRKRPYGQRAIISNDDGSSWKNDIIITKNGCDADIGYPASLELPDKSILTVYYQRCSPEEKCSLLWSRWQI